MVKNVLGGIAGTAVAMGVIDVWEMLVTRIFGLVLPEGGDVQAFADFMAHVPFAAKAMVVIGWLLGAFAGAWLAMRVSGRRWTGWAVAGIVLAGGIINVATLPHPLWMQAGAVLAPLAGGWLAQRAHVTPYPGEPLLG